MTTVADQLNDTPSPTDLRQFIYPANNLFELIQTAKRELERDHAAAKASLATASSILQTEIKRRSHTQGARPGALAAWQIARARAFIDENLHRTIHTKDLGAVAQRSAAHFSRSFKQVIGESPHAYVVRRRLERACQLMITSSASLREIARASAFPIKHICAGSSGRRLVKVQPAGGATLRTGLDEDHPTMGGQSLRSVCAQRRWTPLREAAACKQKQEQETVVDNRIVGQRVADIWTRIWLRKSFASSVC